MLRDWLNFISPNILPDTLFTLQRFAGLLIIVGIVIAPALKRSVHRWNLEWIKELRGSLIRYGALLLLLTLLSQFQVNVLGARGWYMVLFLAGLWRAWKLWGRWKYWKGRQEDENRKLQKLKYMPGR